MAKKIFKNKINNSTQNNLGLPTKKGAQKKNPT